MHHSASETQKTSPTFLEEVERLISTSLQAVTQEPTRVPGQVGRPRELSEQNLWLAFVMGLLRGKTSQRAIWRTLAAGGVGGTIVDVCDQAVYNRLDLEGIGPMQQLFPKVSAMLLHWLQPAFEAQDAREGVLAPFASDVVAIDETYLEPVRRYLPMHRQVRAGHPALLPGKLSAVYDVRRHLWREINFIEDVDDQTRSHAYEVLNHLVPGTLILADLGYFGFQWFDELTDRGFGWISRWREETSFFVIHTNYEDGETLDQIIWFGLWNDRAKHAVRLIQFRRGAILYRYVTNICNPKRLSMQEVAELYARRWDIERAFLVLKQVLGLHLIWSGKVSVMLAQVWACLTLAQIVHALRVEAAYRANVNVFEISVEVLIECWGEWARLREGGLQECVKQGRRLGILRASQRYEPCTPIIEPERLIPLPAGLNVIRQPHYVKPTQQRTPESIEAVKKLRAQTRAIKEEERERKRLHKLVQATLKAQEKHERKQKALHRSEQQMQERLIRVQRQELRAQREMTDPLPAGLEAPPWAFLQPWRGEK